MIRIIPVIDLKAGKAVHARGGDRAHYAPVRSILHEGADPLELARAYRDRLGLCEVYLADLDAIAGHSPDVGLYERIAGLGMTLWVDAGVVSGHDPLARGGENPLPLGERVAALPPGEGSARPNGSGERPSRMPHSTPCASPGPLTPPLRGDPLPQGERVLVAGLETMNGPRVLASLVEQRGPNRVAFSLDLRAGIPLVSAQRAWNIEDPRRIAEIAVESGIRRLILLDLTRVGMGSGVGTLPLIEAIRKDHPAIEIVAGGGIAGPDDVRALEDTGASAALVGSALHDGRIGNWKSYR